VANQPATNDAQRVSGWNSPLKIVLSLWKGEMMWRGDSPHIALNS